MPEAAVLFTEVWKKFRRGVRHDSLRDLIPSAIGRALGRPQGDPAGLDGREFWAIRDVSFEVQAGEALGIIGPNGAGKSTILKLLTRILKPTQGRCQIRGRAGALIEIAGGFHPDLTGRENVYLQGAIMGMKRAEIARKFDEIVDFAGVGEFIDTQVKRYSTGMNARLGFAIAAHLDPDVLLVDEVLSVGDAAFREKCMERMRELRRREVPLVFISHNLPVVLDLCSRAIVMDRGTVKFDGDPARAIQQYRLIPWTNTGPEHRNSRSAIWIARVELIGEDGQSSGMFRTMGSMRIRVHYETLRPVRNAAIAVDIYRGDGIYCAGISTIADRCDLEVLEGIGYVDLVFPKLALLPGCYLGSVGILDGAGGRPYDRRNRAYPFTVVSDRRDAGVVFLDHEWSHQQSTPSLIGEGPQLRSRKRPDSIFGLPTRITDMSTVSQSNPECPVSAVREPHLRQQDARAVFSWDEIERSIPDRFEAIVRQYPHRLAVKVGARAFNYDELNRAANRIAHAILAQCGQQSEPIALLFEDGFEGIAAFFGALKARKCAVTLAPFFPLERLTQILDDSQTRVIVTNTRHIELARTFHNQTRAVLNIDDNPAVSADNPGLSASANDLAALMYTSGSTGTPKAVIRAHRDFLHLCAAYTNKRGCTVNDRLSLVHSLSFGSAYSDLLPTLLNGAALLPFDLKAESMHHFATWLHEEQITVCHLPPVAFRQLASCLIGQNPLPRLRLLCLSGAPITRLDFDLYTEHLAPTTLLEIVMGSTETCSVASAIVDHHFTFPQEGTPIGYPHEGRTILLVDEQHREVGPGEVGEMAIKGRYISAGYWRRPDLTREKFLADPAGGDERIYLTGDLGRRLPDGMLVHLGRKDSLVKIRGYRVEVAEIERALATSHLVREAAVVAWDRAPGEKYLVAYVVPQPDTALSVEALQDWLKSALPDYMLPSSFMFLASLPLTNGKLDRRALPPPDHQRPALSTAYVAARSALESQLVSLWETVLGTAPIGIHDDFFALGGYSLLGANMMAQVHHTCQVDLPLRALFEAPTIAQLAQCIEAKEGRRTYRRRHTRNAAYLFQLQAGGDRPPVFFFPGGGGGEPEFFVYARLARSVGAEYPFYGLRARGADGLTQPHRSVATMAADYLADMQMMQPHGPYFLVGECFGGIAAYEVACQLQSKGEQVAVLVLLDTQRPTERIYWRYRAKHSLGPLGEPFFNGSLTFHWQALCNLPYAKWIPYVGRRAAKVARRWPYLWRPPESARSRAQAVIESNTTQRNQQHIIQARHHYRLTLRRHRPQPYTGPIELLVNEQYHGRDPALGWDTLAHGGLHIHKMPGNHDTYIREHVQVTAERLRACLDGAFQRMAHAHSRSPVSFRRVVG